MSLGVFPARAGMNRCVAGCALAMSFEEVNDGSAIDQDPITRQQLADVHQGHASRSSPTNRAASP